MTAPSLAAYDRPLTAPATGALHAPWPVCPGTIRGLTASLPAAALEVLNDAQLAALTDWSDPACVRATADEATRRDIADRRAELAAPVTPAPVTPVADVAPVLEPAAVTAPDVTPDIATAPARRRGLSPWHAAMLKEYRLARHAWELAAEGATAEYAWEMTDYREHNPPPTWKAFLTGSRRPQ